MNKLQFSSTENTVVELVGNTILQDGDIMQLNCSYNQTEPPPLFDLYFFDGESYDINTVSFDGCLKYKLFIICLFRLS